LLGAIYIAFSYSSKNSIKAAMYLFAGIIGLLILLNFHLYSLFSLLLFLLLFSGAILLRERISQYLTEANGTPKIYIISILFISILTAVFAGLLGAAKWPKIEILYDYNSLSLIFSKYMVAILAIGLLISSVISSAFMIVRNGETE
jgi:hypothetical protein